MTDRILKVNSLLKEEIGNILIREVDLSGTLTTITRVDTSSNMQETRVYISVMPDDQLDRVFETLNREIYGIQQDLNKRLKMRPVPKIIFKKEEQTESAQKVEGVLKDIKDKS